MHAKGELIDAVANRDTNTNDSCQYGGRVDYAADTPRQLGREYRGEWRADGQRHVTTVGEVGEGHAYDGIAAPWGQAVME